MVTTSAPQSVAHRKFVRQAMKAPMLEKEHELELARLWRDEGDEDAMHELTTAYMRLVVAMASKFRFYGLPMSDLISEGNVGLMLAASRFDPSREVRFSTYASWWIRSSIQDYVLRNWSIVRTGTTSAQKSLFFNLRRLRARIQDTDDGQISHENKEWIAQHLGVPIRDVETMAGRMSGADRSLNAPMSADGDAQWQDMLVDETAIPEIRVMAQNDNTKRKHWINEALSCLNSRESHIIRKRRLADSSVTLEKLGKELGISKERVRQIEQAALGKLKKALVKSAGDPISAGLIPDG